MKLYKLRALTWDFTEWTIEYEGWRELIAIPLKVIPLKLFLDVVPSSFVDNIIIRVARLLLPQIPSFQSNIIEINITNDTVSQFISHYFLHFLNIAEQFGVWKVSSRFFVTIKWKPISSKIDPFSAVWIFFLTPPRTVHTCSSSAVSMVKPVTSSMRRLTRLMSSWSLSFNQPLTGSKQVTK